MATAGTPASKSMPLRTKENYSRSGKKSGGKKSAKKIVKKSK